MAINMQAIIKDYRSGMSIKALAVKYKMSEKELSDAITKELTCSVSDKYGEYQEQLKEHDKKVNEGYNAAYKKFQDGEYMQALKLGIEAAINQLNPPQNPYVNTGVAPCPVKWADIKSIFSLIKSLKNLPQIIKNLKNCKSVQQFKIFISNLVKKLKLNKPQKSKINTKTNVVKSEGKTQAQFIEECSKGKNLIDMSDEELVLYYKKLIPDINRKELKCLIDQVHRIKKGEPRWLNTEEERDLLRSIYQKMIKAQKSKGIKRLTKDKNGAYQRTDYDELKNRPANIPFEKKKLTEYQENQLSAWYNKGEDGCIEPIFEELGTVLDHDVYLYRCVTVRADNSLAAQKGNCDFLNTIKEGGIINNGNHYNSTASNINHTLDNSMTFGQSYILKIKVPKGTKVLDMRHHKAKSTEIVLPPCSYKINKINYTTGVVDCDFIPH